MSFIDQKSDNNNPLFEKKIMNKFLLQILQKKRVYEALLEIESPKLSLFNLHSSFVFAYFNNPNEAKFIISI